MCFVHHHTQIVYLCCLIATPPRWCGVFGIDRANQLAAEKTYQHVCGFMYVVIGIVGRESLSAS